MKIIKKVVNKELVTLIPVNHRPRFIRTERKKTQEDNTEKKNILLRSTHQSDDESVIFFSFCRMVHYTEKSKRRKTKGDKLSIWVKFNFFFIYVLLKKKNTLISLLFIYDKEYLFLHELIPEVYIQVIILLNIWALF